MKSLPRKRSETVSRFHPPSGRVERSEGRAEYQFSTHPPRPDAVRPSRREGEVQNQYAEVVSERILKACRAFAEEHVAQILGYLRATQIEHGLLINFDAGKYRIKKYVVSNQS